MISGYFGGRNILKKHSHYKTKADKQAPFLNAVYLAKLASNGGGGRREYREDGEQREAWERSRPGRQGGLKDLCRSQELRPLGSLTIALAGGG